MRKKFNPKSVFALAGLLLMVSCIGVKYVSIEQYAPPRFLLPADATRIAILNNADTANVYVLNQDITVWPIAGDSIMEYVAQSFADAELFSEVIVLDSCIFPKGGKTAHRLTQEEVQKFCNELGVDMLMTCDFGGISTLPNYNYLGSLTWQEYDVDKYFLLAHMYAPTRKDPFYTLILEEPWDKRVQSNAQMTKALQEALPLIGEASVKYFLPEWDLRERAFYSGSAYSLREATICVKEGDWDGAYAFWEKYGQSNKKRNKLIACYNKALYFEMNDSLDKALMLLEEAKTYAPDSTVLDSTQLKEWENMLEEYEYVSDYPYTDFQRITNYERILTERQKEITQLNILKP